MATKAYSCNRFKNLRIGSHIHFRNGHFETDSEAVQAEVESNEWYGVHIHPVDVEEPEEAVDELAEPIGDDDVTVDAPRRGRSPKKK